MSLLSALLDMFSLDLMAQHVWGMENGNQIQVKWNAEVCKLYIVHVLGSSPLSLCSQATLVFLMLHCNTYTEKSKVTNDV